jgi:DUF1707 SHOCT-like domain
MDGTPELRVSDADREQVAESLRHAAGEGRLTVDELGERLDAAYAARTRADLERLTADLPAEPGAGSTARPLPVVPGGGGTRWIISIMSGHPRRGRWRAGPKVININFWGGSQLDFNDAELSAARTEVVVIAIMGGAEIWVPDGLDVEVSQFALMGGNDVQLGRDRPVPGGPVLHLRLVSIWGGTDVRRGRPLSREERRAHKLERREARRLERDRGRSDS